MNIYIQNQEFNWENTKEGITINQELIKMDTFQAKEGVFHILVENKSYQIEIIKEDYAQKQFVIKINGKPYEITAKNRLDLLLQKMGMDKLSSKKAENLKAPMPGLIVEIKVKPGQEVKKGDAILILEAMKMENILKAPTDTTIKSIKVEKGNNVEKNHILVEFV
jgi:acetyl/propionyl-CoA carboxylase alpha subunit